MKKSNRGSVSGWCFASLLALSTFSGVAMADCYDNYSACLAHPDGMNCDANLRYCLAHTKSPGQGQIVLGEQLQSSVAKHDLAKVAATDPKSSGHRGS
ncbi:hypothetical protein LL974_14500 [Xanthomonas campestris pv. cannae]|nr:hypothetical protein [Xanthomonas campestris pv. cannae]